ncbi:CHAD domain-containing protein [Caballeronia sp. LZ033]|uniref:CHAD domain-containing protein n=2 Tax=unclassified Caballeronia TaxID=2646786 RepID=UPI00285F1218|nr:CHAD domain-containing protein [Caballeronia sp. LZ033]MDR5816075.1 CHAD domain-containing protein [Caballeronia sp. LZ033]
MAEPLLAGSRADILARRGPAAPCLLLCHCLQRSVRFLPLSPFRKTRDTDMKKGNNGALAESSFSTYANPLIGEASAQATVLEDSTDAEELHKLRVALRRLRTLLWAYRPILKKDFDDQQRALLKYLASAAGNTRDWDILIELVDKKSSAPLLDAFREQRSATAAKSRDTLSHAKLKQMLHESLSEANRELNTAAQRTPLTQFARKRVTAAEKQLSKRIRSAAKAKGKDYAQLHDVRKAGKKVRYLVEFFEPLLGGKQRKTLKGLKRMQKRFGALNDVVASRALLEQHLDALPDGAAAQKALRSLKKEQKRRMKAAVRLL